mgnify:CR=1 FL=1
MSSVCSTVNYVLQLQTMSNKPPYTLPHHHVTHVPMASRRAGTKGNRPPTVKREEQPPATWGEKGVVQEKPRENGGATGGSVVQSGRPAARAGQVGGTVKRPVVPPPGRSVGRSAGRIPAGSIARGWHFRSGDAGGGCGGEKALMGRLARQTLVLGQDPDSRIDDPDMVQMRPFPVQIPMHSKTQCSGIL